MSEYQYYEFRAIDRPLRPAEMARLRERSSRATITSRRFQNEYSWGDFRGDPAAWMDAYFDAFLYVANWGTRQLALRLPRARIDLAAARRYCVPDYFAARAKGDFVILDFHSEEDGGGWIEDAEDWLPSLIALRADLAKGDQRALYIAWLAAAQMGALEDDTLEPPCPAGLAKRSSQLNALAEFLRVDDDWLEAAAGQPARAASGDGTRRTVAELRAAAEAHAEEQRRLEEQREARRRARRARDELRNRPKVRAALAKREELDWSTIDALVATKKPREYKMALALLVELHDLYVRSGQTERWDRRAAALCETHRTKHSFVKRLAAAVAPPQDGDENSPQDFAYPPRE